MARIWGAGRGEREVTRQMFSFTTFSSLREEEVP